MNCVYTGGSFRINDAFEAFINGDSEARETLPLRLHDKLLQEAREQARELSEDQLEDIVQEVWLLILGPRGAGWNRDRGSAWSFLRQLIKDAARAVRATYAPPGVRTRLPTKQARDADGLASRCTITLEELPMNEEPCVQAGSAEARAELRLVSGQADPAALHAIYQIEVEGEPVNDVAAELGVSRFHLRRLILAAKETFQLRTAA